MATLGSLTIGSLPMALLAPLSITGAALLRHAAHARPMPGGSLHGLLAIDHHPQVDGRQHHQDGDREGNGCFQRFDGMFGFQNFISHLQSKLAGQGGGDVPGIPARLDGYNRPATSRTTSAMRAPSLVCRISDQHHHGDDHGHFGRLDGVAISQKAHGSHLLSEQNCRRRVTAISPIPAAHNQAADPSAIATV
jgi:hypothetical protein